MITKLLCIFTVMNLWLGTSFELPREDMVILASGEKTEGKIGSILDGVIRINTKNGEKTIIREGNIYSPRDIVDAGILKTTRYSGHVRFFGEDNLQIETTSGKVTVKSALVRKIIISHEVTLPSLDL